MTTSNGGRGRGGEGHVIVCGLGHVGVRIAELLLDLGVEVTCLTTESRGEWVRELERRGARVIRGDARDEHLMGEAGLMEARAVIAATDVDAVNVEVALDARRARAVPVVVRVYDDVLAEELEASLDVRRALAVSSVAAPTLATSALGVDVRVAFPLGAQRWLVHVDGGDLRATEAPTTADDLRANGRFRDLIVDLWDEAPRPLRRALVVLVALLAVSVLVFHQGMGLSLLDAFYFIVATVTTTGYGDVTAKGAGAALELYACALMILGSASTAIIYSLLTNVLVAQRLGSSRRATRAKDHAIVVGLDRVGARVVGALRIAGVPVVAVTKDEDDAAAFGAIPGVPIIVGDARRPETLARAGIGRARAILACTGDDADNIAIALRAKRLAPGVRTVVRAFDAGLARKLRQGPIDASFSTSALAAPVFVAAALHEGVRAAFVQDRALVMLVEHAVAEAGSARDIARRAGGTPLLARATGADAFAEVAADTTLTSGSRLLIVHRHAFAEAS